VTITGSFADDLAPFLNQLTGKLSSSNVLDAATGANILATFGVHGATGHAVAVADLAKLAIKGDSDAKARFVSGLSALCNLKQTHAADFDLTGLVKELLELLLDNAGIQVQDAAQMAVGHGISVSIQETTIEFGSH